MSSVMSRRRPFAVAPRCRVSVLAIVSEAPFSLCFPYALVPRPGGSLGVSPKTSILGGVVGTNANGALILD